MKSMKKYFFANFILFFVGINFSMLQAGLNFRSATSTIQISDGAHFFLKKKIQKCKGKIIRDKGGIISGQDIEFENGSFYDEKNRFNVSGGYRPGVDNRKVILDGDKVFHGMNGTCVDEVFISGADNRLEGDLIFNAPIVLQDAHASFTWAGLRRLTQDIYLNGGTIYLEENLNFIDDKKIVGWGNVLCNNHKMLTGSQKTKWASSLCFDHANDIELSSHMQLSQTWTFSGNSCVIFGNNNILSFEHGGNIVVAPGSTVTLRSIILQNVSGTNIRCLDDTAKVIVQDVDWVQSDNFSFTQGSLKIAGEVKMLGGYTFAYQSSTTSTICSNSILSLESGFTFSYDPPIDETFIFKNHLLCFEDATSQLRVKNNATLFANDQGLLLAKGNLFVDGAAIFLANPRFYDLRQGLVRDPEVGIIIGNGNEGDDFACNFAPGAGINLDEGMLIYRNANIDSLRMRSSLSNLCVGPACTLKLDTSIDMGLGRLRISKDASLERAAGTTIKGDLDFFAHE